jgi:adenylate kinase
VTRSPAVAGVCDKCGATEFKRRKPTTTPKRSRSRLEAYHADTAPLIAYYEGTGKLKNIDGMAPIGEVTGSINSRPFDG